jgi:hypothetical protein
MTIAVERKLHIDGRVAELQAQATIKKDIILALVELITNSDDSYRRLENAHLEADGRIIIELMRKRHDAIIRVLDFAEGFDDITMDDRISKYGGDTSGFTEKLGGRGYWGRGLKEAMIGMGSGSVQSIKNNTYYECFLEKLEYTRNEPINVTKQIRQNLGIMDNGTLVEIRVTNDSVRIPQYGTLKNNLEFFYALRDIITNQKRQLMLIEKNTNEKIERSEQLSYKLPRGVLYKRVSCPIQNYTEAYVHMEIYESNEPLSGYAEEGFLRENGILVCSKGSIVDVTLTRKYEENDYARHLYGHATCDYIDHLLRTEKIPIIRGDRGGLDWAHPFCKAVDSVLAKEIAEYVKIAEKRAKDDQKKVESEKTRKRYIAALPKINDIAKAELDRVQGAGEGKGLGHIVRIPVSGFEFDPDFVNVAINKEGTLSLKAVLPYVVPYDRQITITSDAEEIIPLTKDIVFTEGDADNATGLAVGHIKIVGKQVGAEGIMTARVDNLKAEVYIKVVSKRKPPDEREPAKKSGLFKKVVFNKDGEPRRRVHYETESGNIVIATRAPSIAMYFGLDGEGQEEGHCQVMLAELVVETICKVIAKKQIESGKELVVGEKSDSINRVTQNLINKYADKIHDLLVEKKFHRYS